MEETPANIDIIQIRPTEPPRESLSWGLESIAGPFHEAESTSPLSRQQAFWF